MKGTFGTSSLLRCSRRSYLAVSARDHPLHGATQYPRSEGLAQGPPQVRLRHSEPHRRGKALVCGPPQRTYPQLDLTHLANPLSKKNALARPHT